MRRFNEKLAAISVATAGQSSARLWQAHFRCRRLLGLPAYFAKPLGDLDPLEMIAGFKAR